MSKKELIDQLGGGDDPAWFKAELARLKNRTLTLVIISFSVLGVLVGYYLFSDLFGGAFQNITYAAPASTNLTIEWETKFPARTQVEYGTDPIYLNETPLTEDFDTKHSIGISGLLPDKPHVFRIVAEDSAGQKFMSPFYQSH